MSYTPNPTQVTEPTDGRGAGTAAAEFRALKAYLAAILAAGGLTYPLWTNVKSFGAVGDGVTDDRAAIQAAINATISGFLYFPKGDYKIVPVASSDTSPNGLLISYAVEMADYQNGLTLIGEGPTTRIFSEDPNLVIIRNARTNTTIKWLKVDGVDNTNANIGIGCVPENMLAGNGVIAPVYADQSNMTLENVYIENCTEGVKFQPGPQVLGADSGDFYHNMTRCFFNFNTRAIWGAKNADWGTHPNKTTRLIANNVKCTRGNVAYYIEAGSEWELHGCFEELIKSTYGAGPCATATARYLSADCSAIKFFGGLSENCDRPADILANNSHESHGYGATTAFPGNWYTNIKVYGNAEYPKGSFVPVLASAGGGAEGASTSASIINREGSTYSGNISINAAKGTLGAGALSVGNLPTALAYAPGQYFPAYGNGLTLAAGYTGIMAFISGGTIALRKTSNNGSVDAALTLAECPATVILNIPFYYSM